MPWYVRAANNSHGASKAALPSGSNAYDAMEEDGPVGGDGPEVEQAPAPIQAEQPPAQAEPAPVQAEQPPPQEEQAPAPAPAAPTITSSSVKAAPSGAANTRSRIGVGETVVFTGSVAGTWTASIGTASGPNSTTFNWTAPATAANTDATITLTAGSQTVTKTVTVVKPNSISMRNVDSHAALVGAGGACMRTEVTFGPSDVCLGAMQWLEVPGPATDVTGFFTKYSDATLHHDPNPDYAIVDDTNKMEAGPNNSDRDHCAWHSTAGPYSDGGFKWDIPNKYILDTEAPADGRHFTDTTQRFTMNAAGTMTITKAGAST
ncbi:MAG: hypothetical protein OEZ39_17155 [Gammaproteobacteria bacterium]|nr:hypothetical protein [Gammaproteobacteria bacterium]MDH5653591.1 hypothetical protein [Gammaproteobacteria bacterium]